MGEKKHQAKTSFNQQASGTPKELTALEKWKIQRECQEAVRGRVGGRSSRSARGFKL